MKAIIASVVLLLAGCNQMPVKMEAEFHQMYMVTCLKPQGEGVFAVRDVAYWELHPAMPPYMEVQQENGTVIYHYIAGGETCGAKAQQEP